MKNVIGLLISLFLLTACDHEDEWGSVEAFRNAKAPELNGMAAEHDGGTNTLKPAGIATASLQGATANGALTTGATQFLGTWVVVGHGDETKAWDEETQGKTPWANFKEDGTMDGDGTYFPDDTYYIANNNVIMFASGSTQVYAIITILDLKLYTMELIYMGGPLEGEEETIKLWMQKIQ